MSTGSVLFINRVYPPDPGATGQLLAELAPALVRSGWEVTVLTGSTTRGCVPGEVAQGVRVEREAAFPFKGASHWRRGLSYLALYPALLLRALLLPRADVIIVMTDPPLLVVLGALLAWLTRARLVHWSQDLYPEVAEELGVLKKRGLVAGTLRRLSTAALRRCHTVVAIGHCMRARLEERGLDPARLCVIPNWSAHGLEQGGPERAEDFLREQGLRGRFVVMYSGNFGLAHSFEAVLDAAERLQSAQPSIVFVLIGHGPRRAWVEQQARDRRLNNLHFLPHQAQRRLREVLAAADVHLASMRPELCGLVVPSKVYGILAAGRPCVFLGPRQCEVARLIEDYGCGVVLAADDGAGLADRLRTWANQPECVAAAAAQSMSLSRVLSLETAVRAFADVLEAATRPAASCSPEADLESQAPALDVTAQK